MVQKRDFWVWSRTLSSLQLSPKRGWQSSCHSQKQVKGTMTQLPLSGTEITYPKAEVWRQLLEVGCLIELALYIGAAWELFLLPQQLSGRVREMLSSTKQLPALWWTRIWSGKHAANIWPSAMQWIYLPRLTYVWLHTWTRLSGQTLHKHLSWHGVGLKGGIQTILQEEK